MKSDHEGSPRTEFLSGIKAVAPILLGVVPFGLISGIAIIQTTIEPVDGLVMSVLIFSGAALLVALQLITTQTPVTVVIVSALAVNLRFMIYSASVAPLLKHLSKRWKILLAYFLSDQAYAASIFHLSENPSSNFRHWHLFGSGLIMWLVWQISVASGLFVGASLPANLSLEFAIPLTFLSLAVPAIKDKSTAAAAFTAGTAVLLMLNMPLNMGVLVAIILGITAGLICERYH